MTIFDNILIIVTLCKLINLKLTVKSQTLKIIPNCIIKESTALVKYY